ncbi:MAG: xylose isomerase, partial [Phycisphaerae bacterium]
RRLGGFADPVYLHQARLRRPGGVIEGFPDLAEAIASVPAAEADEAELRVHFHVPLFFCGAGGLASTGSLLGEEFWELLRPSAEARAGPTDHLEIETYTFDVLPDDVRPADVTESIRREFEWVLARLPCASQR